jgi:Na+/H+ antiporter
VEHLELVIFGLLVGIVAFASLASLLRVPYPIPLVLGGLVIGFIPGVPSPELDPELVLLIFLPPLLYGAAFFTSLRDLRRAARPIALLSIGLVLVTMGAVALVAHEVIGLSWGVSFVLGAIVSPTDAVAPAEILRRIGAPRRMVTVVEGENLTNDWTALVLYKVAVAAVVSGTFSLFDATVEFVLSGIGGLAVGLVAGRIIREIRRRINDPPTEITISILSGYAAYLPAEELGFSGVIAAVTVGIYMGWYTPELTTPIMRMQGVSVWEILTFLLNAVLFLLIGMQMPSILDDLSGDSAGDLLSWALLISFTVVAVRMLWQFTAVYVIRAIDRREVQRLRRSRWQERVTVGWAGMRGVARRSARGAARDGQRRSVPGARPDHLSRVRRDPRDPRGPGPHTRPAHRAARRGGRRRRRARGGDRPRTARRGRACAARRARRRGLDPRGNARPRARHV